MTSQRTEALQRAAEHWKRQLVDVSGRNRLLNYRDLTVGTLDLTPERASGMDPRVLESLLAGRTVQMQGLFPGEEALADARKRLSTIHRQAQGNLDEKGINTLFAVAGLATWTVETGVRPNAPVILIPIAATPVDAARWDFKMEMSGDPHLNPVLAHMLRTEYGIDPSDLDDDLAGELPKSFSGLTALLGGQASRWSQVRGLSIESRVVLGNFIYTNMPMVADLENNLEFFADNDLIAAIAGVEEARLALAAGIQDPSASQPDIDPPESEFLVLDADASQHRAINRVLAGGSAVIWGPPGTGKSQTIANLISALTAKGKRVLFVAEKRAAIDVVVDRLDRAGLADLVLDAHGGIKSKREFAQGMADSMRSIRSIPDLDHSVLHRRLAERRSQLIGHNDAMHQRRSPWNVTLYEVQDKIIGAPEQVRSCGGMRSDQARGLDRETMDQLMRVVQEWVDLGGHRLESRYPEWAGSNISSPEEAQEALGLVRDLATATLSGTRTLVFAALDEVGLAHPGTVGDWLELLQWLGGVEQFGNRFNPDVYNLDHTSLVMHLSPAGHWWEPMASMFSANYRAVRRTVESVLRTPSKISGTDALQAVELAAQQAERWSHMRVDGGFPRVPEGLGATLAAATSLAALLSKAEGIFSSRDPLQETDADLQHRLAMLASQETVAASLCRIRDLKSRLVDAGFGDLLRSVGTGVPPENAAEAIEHSWLKGVWEDVVFGDPRLAGFTEAVHTRRQKEFIELDHRHLDITPGRIKRAAAEAAIEVMNSHREETDLVNREAAKRTRHLPIRRLFQQAPNVLTAIRPCWAMSPLLVAELVPADSDLFDVVIFDEASQIPPAEAIGVLARAPQAVIAGDDRQLPPTSFFASRIPDDEEEEEEDNQDTALTSDIESILDVAKASPIPEQLLQWHYRSRDGRLIAFSNAHIYQGALTAFPGTALNGPVTHHLVPFRAHAERSARSNPDEVEKVVDMVVDHARRRPRESLGVITFGIHHADNIDNALRLRLRELGEHALDDFFSEEARERFFTKNIERVQGDERDVIILSVGYHKSANGSLPYRFGPLNQEGGERRLNVAVTRARNEVHLVSSFSHHDMDPGRSTARGVELLRQYLEFAASGGSELGAATSGVPLNAFELDVMNRLTEKGIPVTPQYGVAGYWLDFACGHLDQTGRMVLAIEADGASYHSAYTARVRDRLRQEILEIKGWRFHRIWSTAWFRNRDEEVARAVAAWEEACSDSGLANGRPAGAPSADVDNQLPVSPDAPGPAARGARPNVRPGKKITEYSHRELVALARWILSDTLLRTDDDMHREMRKELGFKRGGSRITPAIQRAIDDAKT